MIKIEWVCSSFTLKEIREKIENNEEPIDFFEKGSFIEITGPKSTIDVSIFSFLCYCKNGLYKIQRMNTLSTVSKISEIKRRQANSTKELEFLQWTFKEEKRRKKLKELLT